MQLLTPYLTFDGQCEIALAFYADVFHGRITSLRRFDEAPMQVAEADKARVLHAEFEAEGIRFMASDGMPGRPPQPGSMITLSVSLNSPTLQDEVWAKLTASGSVRMPLELAFWGARFGMLTDRFGIPWMLNCEVEPKP